MSETDQIAHFTRRARASKSELPTDIGTLYIIEGIGRKNVSDNTE